MNVHSLYVFTPGSRRTSWRSLFQDLIISSFQATTMFAAILTLDLFGVTMLSSTFPLQVIGEPLNMEATGNFLHVSRLNSTLTNLHNSCDYIGVNSLRLSNARYLSTCDLLDKVVTSAPGTLPIVFVIHDFVTNCMSVAFVGRRAHPLKTVRTFLTYAALMITIFSAAWPVNGTLNDGPGALTSSFILTAPVYNNDSYQAQATPPSGIFQPIPHVFLGNEDKEGQGPKVKEPSNMTSLRNNYIDRIILTKSQLSNLLLTLTGQDHADAMATLLRLELLRDNFSAKYDDRFYGKKTMQNVHGYLQKNGTFELALTKALFSAKQHLEKGSLSSTPPVRPGLLPTIDVHTHIHRHTQTLDTHDTHIHIHVHILIIMFVLHRIFLQP
jgi:hypothetical protein